MNDSVTGSDIVELNRDIFETLVGAECEEATLFVAYVGVDLGKGEGCFGLGCRHDSDCG